MTRQHDTDHVAPTIALQVNALSKTFADGRRPAVDGATFSIAVGEIFAVIGPSGSGKSTLLRLIAGFEVPDAGAITLGPRDITARPPQDRNIGMVFQDYALFPNMTVRENVAFALRGLEKTEKCRRSTDMLRLVGLAGLDDRFPDQLSGGQQQRVALARTFAATPQIILLDEPFSNLDAARRQATRHELRTLLKGRGTAAILVTHDQEEALSFADRLAVMRDGRLEQVGTPEEVYLRPRNAFVASFLGHANLVPAEAHGESATTVFGEVQLVTPAQGSVLLSIRPEHLTIVPGGTRAIIDAREFKGSITTYWLRIGETACRIDVPYPNSGEIGASVDILAKEPAIVVQ